MFDLVFKAILAAIPSATALIHATLTKLLPRNNGPKLATLNRGPAGTVTPCTCSIEKESL